MTDETGSLGPGGRFARIEETLLRIEGKLDRKVDRADFEQALMRLSLLESGDTPLGKIMLTQFVDLQKQVSDLMVHGSAQAREAAVAIKALEGDVDSLRLDATNRRAVVVAEQDAVKNRYYRWAASLVVMNAASIAIAIYSATHHIH